MFDIKLISNPTLLREAFEFENDIHISTSRSLVGGSEIIQPSQV